MLSPTPIKRQSAKEVADYYLEQESYYTDETKGQYAQWWGKGATALGLVGGVDKSTLIDILDGQLPNGETIRAGVDGKRNLGSDLTFNAPKSVSQALLVGGDYRLLAAHKHAVAVALSEVEQQAASCRVTEDRLTEYQLTGNLVVSRHTHFTSRALDPHLHEHALIHNVTQREDGQWRALGSNAKDSDDSGFLRSVFQNKLYYGAIYCAELAKQCADLGYTPVPSGKSGLFELADIPVNARQLHSKRRAVIEQTLDQIDNPNDKDADYIALNTRDRKVAVEPESLTGFWQQEVKSIGVDIPSIVNTVMSSQGAAPQLLYDMPSSGEMKRDEALVVSEQTDHDFIDAATQNEGETPTHEHDGLSHEPTLPQPTDDGQRPDTLDSPGKVRHPLVSPTAVSLKQTHQASADARQAVQDAVSQLGLWHCRFQFQQVVHQALTLATGRITLAEAKTAVESLIAGGDILSLDQRDHVLTTTALLEKETAFVSLAQSQHKKQKTLKLPDDLSAPARQVLTHPEKLVMLDMASPLARETLTEVVDALDASSARPILLLGNATEKCAMHADLKRQRTSVFSSIVNAFKPERVASMKGYLHQESERIQSPFAGFSQGKQVLLIDGIERMPLADMTALLTLSQKNGSKVIALHHPDDRQTGGSSVAELMRQAGIKPVTMSTLPPSQIDLTVTDTFDAACLPQGQSTLVLTDRKKAIGDLTQRVRDTQLARGELGQHEVLASALTPRHVRSVAQAAVGEKITMYSRAGGTFDVVGQGARSVRLKDPITGQSVSVAHRHIDKQSFSVAKTEALGLREGDWVMGTQSQKRTGLVRGQRYRVTALSKAWVELSTAKQSLVLPLNEAVPLQYDAVRTIDQRGKDHVDHVILAANAYHLSANTLRSVSHLSNGQVTVVSEDVALASERLTKAQWKGTALSLSVKRADTLAPQRQILQRSDKAQLATTLLQQFQSRPAVEKALDFAIEKLSEREAGFTYESLLTTATNIMLGKAGASDLQQATRQRVDEGQLLRGQWHGKTYYTTTAMLKKEDALIATLDRGVDQVAPLLSSVTAPDFLTGSQKAALSTITSTRDRFMVLQGFAGTGKSTLWTSINTLLNDKAPQVSLLGLAPTHEGVKSLRDKGIKAQTLASFLVDRQDDRSPMHSTVVIIDEASQASTENMLTALKAIESAGGRGVIQGDTLQYQSIEAGKALDLALVRSKITKAYNTDIVRQKTKAMQQLVNASVVGDVAGALDTLKKTVPSVERTQPHITDTLKTSFVDVNTLEKTDYGETLNSREKGGYTYDSQNKMIVTAAVDDYLSRTDEVRANSFFIVSTRQELYTTNALIRQGLNDKGMLRGQAITLPQLDNLNHEKVELTRAENYQPNDIAVIDGRYHRVTTVDPAHGLVHCEAVDSKQTKHFMPEHHSRPVELYRQVDDQYSSLQLGDNIRLTKTFKKKGLFAQSRWTVTGIDEAGADLRSADGKTTHRLDQHAIEDAHWTHDYCITGFSAQSATVQYGIGLDLAWHRLSVTPRQWIVGVTRPELHMVVYTTQEKELLRRLNTPVSKTSALAIRDGHDDKPDPGQPTMVPLSPETQHHDKAPNDVSAQAVLNQPIPAIESNDKGDIFSATGPLRSASQYTAQQNQAPESKRLDAQVIKQQLNTRAAEIITKLLGEPNRSSTVYHYRYEKNDALSISVSGPQAGVWKNFRTGETGDLLDLIKESLGGSFRDALVFADQYLGGTSYITPIAAKAVPHFPAKPFTQHQQEMRNYAGQLIEQSVPVKGTLSEKYLQQRGITIPAGLSVRHCPRASTGIKGKNGRTIKTPALLVVAHNEAKTEKSAQVILLGKDGHKLTKDQLEGRPGKKIYGALKNTDNKDFNHATIHPRKKGQSVSLLTEGVEDALTIKQTVGNQHIVAFLGKENLKNIQMNRLHKTVVNVLDNDGLTIDQALKKDPIVQAGISRQLAAGKTVYIAMPQDAKDMNELLQQKGEQAVKACLADLHKVDAQPERQSGDKNNNNVNLSRLRYYSTSSEIEREQVAIAQRIQSMDMKSKQAAYQASLKQSDPSLKSSPIIKNLEQEI